MKNISAILIMILLQVSPSACTEAAAPGNPPDYDLTKPVIFNMPSVLEEISGIAFSHGNADTIYAEQDEEGKLFYFHLGDAQVRHTKFSKRGDFEDVTICNTHVVMLRSDGVFFTFLLADKANKDIDNVKEQDGLLPAGEFESLYADEASNTIYLLCKNCSDDKAANTVTGFIFTMGADGTLTKKSQFTLDEKTLKPAGADKFKLKASAIAKNPVSHQWYILSSVNKLLVITDEQWKPLGTYALNSKLFTQPEGIAFDRAGTLYISNEKGNAALGTVLKFAYHKK